MQCWHQLFHPWLGDSWRVEASSFPCRSKGLAHGPAFGHHKASRRWTWHSPNGQHHNQIDYILVKKGFWSGVNTARTRSFPGADIGSDHNLLMMTWRLRLKKISKPKYTRLKFDLEKLKDPNMLETFQAMIGRRFAPLTIMSNKDTDINSTQQWLKQPVRSLAKIVRRRNPESLQKFLICATKGENWKRKGLSLKDLRNTRKWTTTSRGAWKKLKQTG